MRLKAHYFIALLGITIVMLNVACKKEKLLSSGGEINYSVDTLTFDTVFTAQGSFTTSITIRNPQNQKISLSSVRLAGGSNSYFHLNVNGYTGNSATDIEIAAHDSIYVFATVNIDPTNANTPFVVEDQLIATLNGKDFSLPFIAYGQNAYYINFDKPVTQNETWKTDKPYVIIDNAYVAHGATLTIPKGCRIYVHANSRLYVDGTLQINGTKEDSVIFQGDRLDRNYFGYEGYPGEWGGLYFSSTSTNNSIDYAIIKNCGNATNVGGFPAAIQVLMDSVHGATPQLTLKHTIIENSIGYGLLSVGGTVTAENCLINTCGAQCLAFIQGGTYNINNCTFVCYGTDKVNHTQNVTAAILNYFPIDDTHFNEGNLQGTMRNCVVYGSLDDEITFLQKGNGTYNFTLENCLIKSKTQVPDIVTLTNCILNEDPKFKDYVKWDYHPDEGSPLIGNGATISGITTDLDGNTRTMPYDIGCY